MDTKQYREMYVRDGLRSDAYWARPGGLEREADLWYNRNLNEMALGILGDLCKGKKVLDIGARFWVEKELLAGIDAEEIVKIDIVGVPEDDIIEANAERLPFKKKSFDVVICREVIEHVDSAHKVFVEIRRVLKDKGYLYITTPNVHEVKVDGIFHVRGYTPRGFLNELGKEGFEIVKMRGNVPNFFSALLPLSEMGFNHLLVEYKEMADRLRDWDTSYFVGTVLFVLVRKV